MSEEPSAPDARTLRDIQSVVQQELTAFQRSFRASVSGSSGLLNTVTRYVLRQKGKRIRPTLVLLAAKVCGGITEATFRAATLVELLHTATLVHDDVVDEAETRRGAFSVNALWGNRVAVLVGDYFLSQGLLLALKHDDTRMLRILSDAVRRMAEGELLQVKRARSLGFDEATYFRIISDKTASLISACTMCGAVSASDDATAWERMETVGEQLGLAFQIRDDLFDYGTQGIGKPVGLDLKEKLTTLPLVFALDQADRASRRQMVRILRRRGRHPDDLAATLAFVKEHGGLKYARSRMVACVQAAQETLSTFPPSPAREAMIALADYVTTRKR